MHERDDSPVQAAMLIWAIRGAAVALLAALTLISVAGSKAHAGIGFDYARSSSKVAYAGGGIAFQFKLRGTRERDLKVEVVRKGAGQVTAIEAEELPAGTPLAVDWDGLNANGKPAKPGRYAFRVRNLRNKKVARLKRVRGKRVFKLRSSVFPVRGPYNFGSGQARFGAGRSGHSHQGQDIFASCGTPLVSPGPGKVVARAYQGSAGHYVVVKLAGSGQDAVFMHLQKRSWTSVGTPVYAGQQIGRVGETGNARGCHLHFELWTAPGWYRGGSPYDPFATLKAWA